MRSLRLSGKIQHIGCLIFLSLVFVILIVIPQTVLLSAHFAYVRPAETADGVVIEFIEKPVQRRGPDGEEYTDYDRYAFVQFQTADGKERTFTNLFSVPRGSTLDRGDSVTVRYNDAWALLADDYEQNMAGFWKRVRMCLLATAVFVLIAALIVMHGKRHKNKEKAADSTGNAE